MWSWPYGIDACIQEPEQSTCKSHPETYPTECNQNTLDPRSGRCCLCRSSIRVPLGGLRQGMASTSPEHPSQGC